MQSQMRHGAQHTLATAVGTQGIGVHSGRPVTLSLRPAPPDSGLVFVRSDLDAGVARVPARWDHVVDTRLSTVLGNAHGTRVGTVEHLFAALAACAIDNLIIELDGPEVPILDGSALQWMALIEAAGRLAQAAPRVVLRVLAPVRVADGDKWALLRPAPRQKFGVAIDFAHPAIGRQRHDLTLDAERFRREVAAARTFGFLHQIEALRAQGLTRGGSYDNAIVLDAERVLNPGGLRFANEFARHKLLDCVGDLYLAGVPILGEVSSSRGGHGLNNQLLRALFANSSAWRLEDGACGDAAGHPLRHAA
jgi:UDP-3-O-[3-hydroxymyristoyl] N-acetylglucosamine deacetylase